MFCTAYFVYPFLLLLVTPEYLVVQFEVDKEVCAVPVERLTGSGAVCVGEQCEVKWTNGETYTAKVLAQGR